MMQVRVDPQHAGSRIDVVISASLDISRAQAARRIAAGEVTVNNKPVAKSYVVAAGDVLDIVHVDPAASVVAPPCPPILYRDEHLIVIDKPAGLVVHTGAGHVGDTLVDALQAAGVPLAGGDPERRGIAHRLDRDTSGVMVIAVSTTGFDALVDAFANRRLQRRYIALVAGTLPAAQGRVEGPIGRDPRDRKRFAVVSAGKPAATSYKVIATATTYSGQPLSVLMCQLHTGRTHQIRVHLRELGHPVIADPVYGRVGPLTSDLGLVRQALHAYALSGPHPVSRLPLHVRAPVSWDIAQACALVNIDLPGLLHEAESTW
ncbi:MAG: RluA family pseudouridine synthase [Nitriliruptoraceae bacterium]